MMITILVAGLPWDRDGDQRIGPECADQNVNLSDPVYVNLRDPEARIDDPEGCPAHFGKSCILPLL